MDLPTIISIISGITAIVLFFPAFYSYILKPIINFNKLKKTDFNIIGEWNSAWEPKAMNESEWISEKVVFTRGILGKISLTNVGNEEGYNYSGAGKIYNSDGDKYLIGNWSSNQLTDNKKGKFIISISRNGHLIGNFFGPNTQGILMSGGWILSKSNYQLEYGKMIYKNGYLTDENIENLKLLKSKD